MIIWLLTLWMTFIPLASIPSLFGNDKAAEYEQDHTTWVYPPWKHTWGVVRATQAHLTFYSLGKSHFINPQGLATVRLEETDDPDSKSDNNDVTVYGVNSGENTIIYNKSMTSLGFYAGEDIPDKPLNEPWDIAALPNGLVFLTDAGNRRLLKLRNRNSELCYEMTFGTEDSIGLVLPRGIAVTEGGRVVVADAGSDRILFFDTLGVFTGALGGFDHPVGLAAVDNESPYMISNSSYFVVSDSLGRRIRKVDYDGRILYEIDVERETGLEDCYVGHLDIDKCHNIITTDSVNCCILKFENQLHFLSAWGQKGIGRARFIGPTGIAIWRRFGQTFVAEEKGAHHLRVGTDLIETPRISVEKGPMIRIHLGLTEKSNIDLKLIDNLNKVARQQPKTLNSGQQTIDWLLTKTKAPPFGTPALHRYEKEDEPPEPGIYTLRMTLRATYSSKVSFKKVVETEVELTPDKYNK